MRNEPQPTEESAAVILKTPYFEVVARPQPVGDPYYSLRLPDYVSVVAYSENGRLLLIEQFRPVLGRVTLELPSGMVDPGEDPVQAAARELMEETGWSSQCLTLIGNLAPDIGRMENRMWIFKTVAWPVPGLTGEAGISVTLTAEADIPRLVGHGLIEHALTVAALAIAGVPTSATTI